MKEKRYVTTDAQLNLRAEKNDADELTISGYASVFNRRSKLIFERGKMFFEIIEPNAFDNVLQRSDLDVILTYQHNSNEVLARKNVSKDVKSLELSVDDKGLRYTATLANTTLARDTWENVRAGNLYENSFVFSVEREGERWEQDNEGNNIRYIKEVSGLYDVSVVVNGAYADTDMEAAKRSLEDFEESINPEPVSELERDKMEVEILQLKK